MRDAQRGRPRARPPRRAGPVLDRARRSIAGSRAGRASSTAGSCARSSTRSWPGRWSARTTGASRPGWRSTFRRPVDGRHADPRRGVDHPVASPDRRHRRPHRRRRRPAPSSRPRPASYVAADAARKRDLRSATASARPSRHARRRRRRRDRDPSRRPPIADRRRPTHERGDRPCRRVRRRPTATRPRRSAPRLAELINDPDALRDGAHRGPRGRSPTRSTSPGSSASRPGIGAVHGVRWPLLAAVSARVPQRDRATTGRRPLLFVADRLFHETELEARWFAFGLLERTLATRDRADLAAPAPRRARGRRLDHGRLARPPVRQGHRRRAVPLGRARAARLQPVALGAPARRLDHRDDDPRATGGAAATRTSPATPCRSSASLMGDAEPDVQKALSWAYRSLAVVDRRGHRGRAPRPRPSAPPPTDDGHRAWVIRDTLAKLDPATADELRDRARRDPQARRRPVHLGGGRRPPPGSAACPTRLLIPEPPARDDPPPAQPPDADRQERPT